MLPVSLFAMIALAMSSLVAAAPMPMPLANMVRLPTSFPHQSHILIAFPQQRANVERSYEPLNVIPAYRRADAPTPVEKRQQATSVPLKNAAMAPEGSVIPYGPQKRAPQASAVPVQNAAMAPDGVVKPYTNTPSKRDDVPVQNAAMAPDGVVKPYTNTPSKRDDVPVQNAAMAPDGVVKPYTNTPAKRETPIVRRQTVRLQDAAMAPDGVVKPYSAQQ